MILDDISGGSTGLRMCRFMIKGAHSRFSVQRPRAHGRTKNSETKKKRDKKTFFEIIN